MKRHVSRFVNPGFSPVRPIADVRPQQPAVSSSSARSNQNVAQGEGNKPPVVHPRSSQYRWMKSEWRANVYLARSRVQVIWASLMS